MEPYEDKCIIFYHLRDEISTKQEEPMNERITASQEQIAAAMAYEDLFVKGLFKEWTIRVVSESTLLIMGFYVHRLKP